MAIETSKDLVICWSTVHEHKEPKKKKMPAGTELPLDVRHDRVPTGAFGGGIPETKGTDSSPVVQPLLTLSPGAIRQAVDASDPAALFEIWTVFTRCKDKIANGRRLENLSWRLYGREILHTASDNGSVTLASSLGVPELVDVPGLEPSRARGSGSTVSNAETVASTSSGSRREPLSSEKLQTLFSQVSDGGSVSGNGSGITTVDANANSAEAPRAAPAAPAEPVQSAHVTQQPAQQQQPQTSATRQPMRKSGSRVRILREDSQPSLSRLVRTKSHEHARAALRGTSGDRRRKHVSLAPGPLTTTQSSQAPSTSQNQMVQGRTSQSKLASKLESQHSSQPASQPAQLVAQSSERMGSEPAEQPRRPAAMSRNRSSPRLSLVPQATLPDRQGRFSMGSDSEDTSDDEDEDGRFSRRHRNGTSVSIVRGFSPSNVSVSVVNRWPQKRSETSNGSSADMSAKGASIQSPVLAPAPSSSSAAAAPAAPPTESKWKLTKARPNKLPREKMFFIASSPSDSEFGGESLSSAEHDGSPEKETAADKLASRDPQSREQRTSGGSANSGGSVNSKVSVLSRQLNRQARKPADDAVLDSDSDSEHNEDGDDDDDDDDDNESAWDSVDDESDTPFDDETYFARDDEKPKKPLVKPSLLSSLFLNNHAMLQQQQQQQREQLRRQNSANSNDTATSSEDGIKPSEGFTDATVATHMMLPTGGYSPRTTRRNMLATELSESVRRNLLWERQQAMAPSAASINDPTAFKTTTPANPSRAATLRRSMTTTGVPGVASHAGSTSASRNASVQDLESWKEDLDDSNLDFNYHARGW